MFQNVFQWQPTTEANEEVEAVKRNFPRSQLHEYNFMQVETNPLQNTAMSS